jgi:hypothetical protein
MAASPDTRVHSMLRARYWIWTAATLFVLTGCGGGNGGSAAVGPTGSVALRAVWEVPSQGGGATFEGSSDIPGAVQTVEVLLQAGDQTFRELLDPTQSRRAVIAGVPPGTATVRVFGYDVRLLGLPDLTVTDVAPSYASQPIDVDVKAGQTTAAGAIEVSAQPFVTDFAPLPDDSGIAPAEPIQFLVATATEGIDLGTLQVALNAAALVANGVAHDGVTIAACSDAGDTPCGENRGISGFRVTIPGPLAPQTTFSVRVQASDLNDPPRRVDYEYSFDTGSAGAS